MKATIKPRRSDRVGTYRKDALHRSVMVHDRDTGRAVVTLRTYWPGSVAYACVWISHGDVYASGAGKAGGGGYCKISAAADAAMRDAGVTLSEPIDGRGMAAMRDACEAIARAVTGKRKFIISESHA